MGHIFACRTSVAASLYVTSVPTTCAYASVSMKPPHSLVLHCISTAFSKSLSGKSPCAPMGRVSCLETGVVGELQPHGLRVGLSLRYSLVPLILDIPVLAILHSFLVEWRATNPLAPQSYSVTPAREGLLADLAFLQAAFSTLVLVRAKDR